jgi:ABC-type uncharacterized transport system substrate-binding protein
MKVARDFKEPCPIGRGAQALYVVEDPIFFAHRMALLNLASMARLPTIHELVRWPEAGALISYGPDLQDLFRRAAVYVGRILNGAQPADLPVEQPTKFVSSISRLPSSLDWKFRQRYSHSPTW